MRRLASFLCAAALSAPAQQDVVTFKANANLVIVTVFVRDRQGKALEGLTKDDFQVLENGQAQTISVFEYQKVGNENLPKFTAQVEAAVAPPARPVDQPAFGAERQKYRDRRLMVLYFDWSSMQPDEQIRARQGAEKFLREDMTSSDLVSIMSYTTRLRIDQEFTTDREALLAVLKKYESGAFTDTPDASLSTDENPDEAGFTPDVTEFTLFNTDLKLAALERAVQALGGIPEKKALIYYSSGVGQTGVDNQSQLRATVNAAVRSNVSFYPVDARGLNALPPGGDASTASPRGSGVYSGSMQRQQRDTFRSEQDTLFALASDTGGKASLDTNDLGMGIRTAQADVQAYYLLGYYSNDEKKDGRFRRVEVKLTKNAEARLDYRRGYFSEKEFKAFNAADKERQLQEALQSGDPITDLPLALEVDWFQASPGRFFVPVAVKIPGSQIPLAKKGGVETTEFDFVAEVRTAVANAQAAVLRDTIKIKLPESRLQSRNLVYDTGFALGPGEYKIKFLARENITGKIGTFEAKFTIPDWSKATADKLKVSSLVLASVRQPTTDAAATADKKNLAKKQQNHPLVKNGMKLVPSVTRVFTMEQPIRAFAEVYDSKVQAALAIYDGSKKVYESRPAMSDKAVELAVPAKTLSPGRYVAQLTLVDTEKGRFEFLRAALIIEQPRTDKPPKP